MDGKLSGVKPGDELYVEGRWGEDVCRRKADGLLFSAGMAEALPDDYEKLPSRGYCGLAGPV